MYFFNERANKIVGKKGPGEAKKQSQIRENFNFGRGALPPWTPQRGFAPAPHRGLGGPWTPALLRKPPTVRPLIRPWESPAKWAGQLYFVVTKCDSLIGLNSYFPRSFQWLKIDRHCFQGAVLSLPNTPETPHRINMAYAGTLLIFQLLDNLDRNINTISIVLFHA